MASNPAMSLASAMQSASINRSPSPHHDINPSTAASEKVPAEIQSPPDSDDDAASLHSSLVDPSNTIQRAPRRGQFPPLPDMRFEQSYLASIKNCETSGHVAYITLKDQFVFPLVQGMAWNLILFGWRHWNRNTKFAGRGIGSRIRRWWWQVNNWEVPREKEIQRQGVAGRVKEFYVDEFSSSLPD